LAQTLVAFRRNSKIVVNFLVGAAIRQYSGVETYTTIVSITLCAAASAVLFAAAFLNPALLTGAHFFGAFCCNLQRRPCDRLLLVRFFVMGYWLGLVCRSTG